MRKIDIKKAREIIFLDKLGIPKTKIAEKQGVDRSTVYQVLNAPEKYLGT